MVLQQGIIAVTKKRRRQGGREGRRRARRRARRLTAVGAEQRQPRGKGSAPSRPPEAARNQAATAWRRGDACTPASVEARVGGAPSPPLPSSNAFKYSYFPLFIPPRALDEGKRVSVARRLAAGGQQGGLQVAAHRRHGAGRTEAAARARPPQAGAGPRADAAASGRAMRHTRKEGDVALRTCLYGPLALALGTKARDGGGMIHFIQRKRGFIRGKTKTPVPVQSGSRGHLARPPRCRRALHPSARVDGLTTRALPGGA